MIIYKITNLVNGKLYIGQTVLSTINRWNRHRSLARCGSETYIHRAIRKYGEYNFTIEMIDDSATTKSKLNLLEQHHITIINPQYNMTTGGEGGDTSSSPNYIQGMRNRRSYKGSENPNYGKRGSDSPNYGQKRGRTPKISEALKQPVIADGRYFPSIGECEKTLQIKWAYSSRKYPDRFHKVSSNS